MRIADHECGVVFKQGSLKKVLGPGFYFDPGFNIRTYHRKGRVAAELDIALLEKAADAERFLRFARVEEGQICLVFQDSVYLEALKPGNYAYWHGLHNYDFVFADVSQPFIHENIKRDWLRKPGVIEQVQVFTVQSYEKGALYIDRTFQRLLEPGDYAYWKCADAVEVHTCDLRIQQLDISGQELLSKDKVTLRINFTCQIQAADPEKVLRQSVNPLQQLYSAWQLSLREYTGGFTLDELLENREKIGTTVLEHVKEKAEAIGYKLISAGARDIILPGEVREIMNRVLLAEKQAQANIIQRREETASTRSLMNTAKLMENNPTLLRLKELESLEKMIEKVQEIKLMGGGSFLDQLGSLLSDRKGDSS
ncbi:MAG: peptidase [Spirochaetaceae bacterium]|nr:peptidase [Spirochaetaceae bacterium]|tara:strand:- start:380577 stop:381677 length:1101 start_codon:yes stop_codon:yes gene_type:complete